MTFMNWATDVLHWKLQFEAIGADRSKPFKDFLSSNCPLKFECMKKESLVIVNQHVTVKLYFSSAHTARHSSEICLLKVNCVLLIAGQSFEKKRPPG
jgi:hypothetical protein